MAELVGASWIMSDNNSLQPEHWPHVLIHDGKIVCRGRPQAPMLLLKQSWAMRDLLVELSDMTPDSRIGVERMQRINALLMATEPANG